MVKRFSKKYGNKSFQLPAIRKLCQDACQCLPDAAKTNMASVVRIQVFSLCTVEYVVANTSI